MLAQVFQGIEQRTGIDTGDIDDVVVGSAGGDGDHGADIARMAVLVAGWPQEVAGITVHRFCGSGHHAVNLAAMGILSGHQQVVVAGGVDSMSRFTEPSTPTGRLDGDNPDLRARHPIVPQGISADLIATLEGFTREDCDTYAVSSQERTAAAVDEDRFSRSLVPVRGPDGTVVLDRDELPRPGTTMSDLARLDPSFAKIGTAVSDGADRSFDDMALAVYPEAGTIRHVHHAGNSLGVADGASGILLCAPDYARAHGLQPRARLAMSAVAGAEPVIMLTAPAAASAKCLARAGMTAGDIDLFEVNEAFASVVLKVIRDLDLDPDKVNVNGGAIALGHPIGATGPMLIQTALDELERRDATTGLITMCTGGGMATACIIERI